MVIVWDRTQTHFKGYHIINVLTKRTGGGVLDIHARPQSHVLMEFLFF